MARNSARSKLKNERFAKTRAQFSRFGGMLFSSQSDIKSDVGIKRLQRGILRQFWEDFGDISGPKTDKNASQNLIQKTTSLFWRKCPGQAECADPLERVNWPPSGRTLSTPAQGRQISLIAPGGRHRRPTFFASGVHGRSEMR